MLRPFSVGGGEGGGGAVGGIAGWLLNAQSTLTHLMSGHVRALASDPSAIWGLLGLGLLYGVFHAAGPGHGKAVIASYMMASDRAVKRGIGIAFLAALLQGAVAIALVGVAAIVLNATAARMNVVADDLALASYAGIVAIGLWLIFKKGKALLSASRAFAETRAALAGARLALGADWRPASPALPTGTFRVETPEGVPLDEAACGHVHAPDPMTLGDAFSWRGALAAAIAAGSRPCSGSILVLVFALAQGAFASGVAATLAISLGTGVTTGALAWGAVFAKSLALRFAAGEDTRVALIARGFEFAAALLVFAFGLALLSGMASGLGA